MTIVVHSGAAAEIEEAAQYYANIDSKLAAALLRELRRMLAQISSFPQGCPTLSVGTFRQCRLKKFPYVVIYEVRSTDVLVVAMAHAKRQPGHWLGRS